MKTILILAAAAALAAPAAAAPACFRTHDIAGHRKVDNQTLYFRVQIKDVYRVTTKGACLAGATDSDPLVMKVVGASDMICNPVDLDLGVHIGPGGGVSHCIVDTITKLTPQEAAAIPKKLKP